MATKPPIGLSVVLNAANGADYVWQSDAADPGNRATGINWRTERGSGFMDGSCVLPRDVRGDYLDLRLLNAGQFVGADGSVAYEGILNIAPRSVDTGGHSITPTFIGPIALAQDEPFSEVYADRAFASWGEAPLNRKVSLTGAGRDIATLSWAVDEGLVAALPNQAVGAQSEAELWYQAPSGVNVGQVMYSGTSTTFPAGYEAPTLFAFLDDAGATGESYAETFDATLRTRSLTVARPYVVWRVYANGTADTPTSGANRRITLIAVYGNHGLTTRTNGTEPDALWLSDILTDIARRFVPTFDTSGVQENRTLVKHCRYESMLPHDAWLDLNKYAQWELGVWEDRRLEFRQADLTDYDWEVRLADRGTSTTLQGDDASNLRNGIMVQYTEAGSGKQITLSPDDHDELRDDSVDNPANQWDRRKWGAPYVLSQPCDEDMAIAAGQQKLADDNQPREAGDVTVTGHIRDGAGHWQPYWKPRAGETVAITDFPNARPRRIAATSVNHDSFSMTISVDSTLSDAEAFLDLYGAQLAAANLG
jgi:hypothetical protein